MATTAQNASMAFRYIGTDVQLYGAQRGNHGRYQVTLDNFTYSPQSGYAPDPGNFQVVLFESHDLQQGNHTVTITNVDSDMWLDIDFVRLSSYLIAKTLNQYLFQVTWTSTFGDPEAALGVTAVDDGDSAFQYSAGDWAMTPPDVGKYFSGTGQCVVIWDFTFSNGTLTCSVTGNSNAKVQLTFSVSILPCEIPIF